MAKYARKDSLAWGIILIVLGLTVFLYNMEIDLWGSIARLWPVILIAWGGWKFYFGLKERLEEKQE